MPVAATVSSSVPWLFTPADTPFYIALNADLNGIASSLSTFPPTPTRAGDILYASGSTASTWTHLAGNNSGTLFLQETSVGVPSWASPSGSGSLVSLNTYASTQTITIPATATKAAIRMWGGTGGSGGVSTGQSGATGAAGYLEKYLTGLTAGNTVVFTLGAAGSAGSNVPSNGGNGSASTLASGTQTITTLTANGSNGSLSASSAVTAGTVGGTATNGDLNVTGQTGSSSAALRVGETMPGGSNNASQGADGVSNLSAAQAGNPGTPGGMVISWFT